MEYITFNKKNLQIVDKINSNTYKVLFKNKNCLLLTFSEDDFNEFFKGYNELKLSGIKIAKLLKKDKKEYKVIIECLSYEKTALELILNDEINDLYLREIFKIAWYAKHANINIDYKPHNFALINEEFYYLPLKASRGFDKAKSFELEGIRYWYYTKEFNDYCHARNIQIDKSKIKDEYKTNKEIVLAVCRYQR